MKHLLIYIFTVAITIKCYPQKPIEGVIDQGIKIEGTDPMLIKDIPDSVFWASFFLLDRWEICTRTTDGVEWYIARDPITQVESFLKIPVLIYFPRFEDVDGHTYQNVILDENILFDCDKKMYKIMNIKYSFNYIHVFDIVDNPNGTLKKVPPNSIWNNLLNKACQR